ncbi:4a-hydroxytetrahydrobiopterin dehydratase [Denitratisoma oestradiolicum]|uniref:Putative pterin-4-alpha-carbinolamine dehydratase n=1 Tax=Denitratisoma oestradiolicum TaxID=311182 RepID=A0A6S6Y4S9_9PROT|nr:4a-hydroxytetrahydrobiopterin dehydratase [Denitratisoma oestradiolicum]TWO79634.1 hypothetical protein CBW56_13745 [Denitratisoma oestradiolicum]CAB1370437.1 putative pterin-4-alpha-carbinolamine dehydratase [Denitratisoma oestradiolicum]
MTKLTEEACVTGPGRVHRLAAEEITALLPLVPQWTLENGRLVRLFRFGDYSSTLAFVNASAWISENENHHPELTVNYGRCQVAYSTHDCDGLSRNDFICAAKLDQLFEHQQGLTFPPI